MEEHVHHEREVTRGLEGVCAAETRISYVDGVNGQLYYSGYNIHDLAERVSFAEAVYLLWHDRLPTAKELAEFRSQVTATMRLPAQVIKAIELTPPSSHPMDVLRSSVSILGMFDPDAQDNGEAANRRKATRLLAEIPTIVAALHRVRKHEPVLSPDPHLDIAANFLYMLHGRAPDEPAARAMDLLLLLHADHGLNASTFAARVAASTEADMHSALTAAVGTLKGRLHGGANERVIEMLFGIGGVEMVQDYIHGMLAEGHKIMGFGHRVYKTEDPRATHLRRTSETLCQRAGQEHLYEISHRIEQTVKAAKGIYPNVDFYSATVQHALGIPKEFFTSVFAASRAAGWIAHILEQYGDNRLIRPTSKYVGQYGRELVPLAERG